MDYNTQRSKLILPEYGRNIHQMVDFLRTIEDKNERNEQAKVVINVMSAVSIQMKNKEEMQQRLWTQLLIMAEFDLDVDIPVTIPSKEKIYEKPEILPYPKNKIKIRYYGHNVEILAKELTNYSDEDIKYFAPQMMNLMKKNYLLWNKDIVADDIIIKDFERLIGRTLNFPSDFRLANSKNLLPKNNNNNNNKKKKKKKIR